MLFGAMSLSRLSVVSSRIPVARLSVICPKVCLSSIRLELLLKIHDDTLFRYELLLRWWWWLWRWLHDFQAAQSGLRLPVEMVDAPVPADKAAVVHGINGLLQLIPKAREVFLG